ncbi:restriction endonuclease [Planococcus sp. APC 3906]|uniref:restriction endonuclease n=1 Tax=Planococcus sp. APC 3906 TaxID=3035194 RepID=UPI0025B520BD|nr:restriction endonuclease [Planococcus sp. APC 3906]MDN3450077.1 restriction endonuclease [Planococcus sp. APC 3906]
MFNLLNLYRFLKVLIVVLSTLLLLTIFENHPLMSFTGFCILFAIIIANLYLHIEKIEREKIEERRKILLNSDIFEIDIMSGREFEHYLRYLFINAGYRVKLTPASGDFGADLILETETQRIAVQAKRYKSKVGIKAVQEIASAKSHYRANETWVVTNNFFTAAAVELAQSNGVKLCDRNFLINYSLKYRESNQTISRVELRKGI